MEREPSFTTAQVQQLTSLTLRQLNYWDHTGLLKPSGAPAAGPGSRRLYTFTDLVQLRTIAYLRDAGITLQKIRKALAYLAQHMPEIKKSLAELRLVALHDGAFLLVESQKRFIDLVRTPGQLIFFVPVGLLAQETRQTLQKLQTRQALVSTRIQVDPAIMGGLPVIRGTRIPVATIVKQARAGLSPAAIAKSLRITEADVQAALAYAEWHRQRGRPRK